MSGNRGIQHVSKRELNAVADGGADRVTSLSLGKGDGLLNAECKGGTWPSGAMGADSTLWFPTQDGVAVIDPEMLATSSHPVPPHIEAVLIDRVPVPGGAGVRMMPGQEALEIQYTGLSLVNSERIRFRYRLTDLDRDWVDAGTRRTAYYSHVPPGDYTFSVMAAGSDGVWTNHVASLSVSVVPPFRRTSWFLLLTVATCIGAGGFAYRRRVAGLERARAAQERFTRQLIDSQEQERRRIAAELHDSLGVQESLNNIVKHSGATRASIDIADDGPDLVITIADNGKGFDTKSARTATIGSGFGLAGVAERVGMLGGRHSIVSTPGQGTTVTIVLPKHPADSAATRSFGAPRGRKG